MGIVKLNGKAFHTERDQEMLLEKIVDYLNDDDFKSNFVTPSDLNDLENQVSDLERKVDELQNDIRVLTEKLENKKENKKKWLI